MQLRLKKSLGQHFLTNENVCNDIVAATMLHKPTQVLEVGPGGGAITKYLVKIEKINFKAVELDTEKVAYLSQKYPSLRNNIIHQSVLDMDKPFENKFTVVGNFPYNISTEILFKLLEWRNELECIVGMFQKEVALRVAAKEGSKVYGVTSVLLQTYFAIEYLFDVEEKDFRPPPKVKSGVIRLIPLQQPVAIKNFSKMQLLVKTAFNQRRKTLRNAVKSIFTAEALNDPIFDKRAEQLSVQDFAALTFKMQ
jgi:16S rRNA (adenine1518-N6/adenine1519-N6)-dimethyltransferase